MAVTETWLKGYISDAQVSIDNYNVFRSDRQRKKGGGCLLYIHNSLIISDTYTYEDSYNNLVLCYIEPQNVVLVAVYRPPDAPKESFDKLLNSVQRKLDDLCHNRTTPDIYFMGDLNFPNMDWCSDTSTSKSQELLVDFIDRNFLNQVITEPTRGNNILDVVLTNKPQDIIEVSVTDTKLSDHDLVECMLSYSLIDSTACDKARVEMDKNSFRAADYHRADYDAMNEELSSINWTYLHSLCEDEDTDGSMFLELFRLTVLQLTLKHSPRKERVQGDKKSKKLREKYTLKRRRRKLNARIAALERENPTSHNLPKLKEEVSLLVYEIQEMIKKDLNARELKAVSTIKTNPKYFFSYAKRFAKAKSSVAPLRDKDNNLVTDPKKKAEVLQGQYTKVFSDPHAADVDQCTSSIDNSDRTTEDVHFTPDDIIEAIKELDPYSAAPDGDIPAKVLCSCKEQLATPLMLMWSQSFETGTIPPSLKNQYITPVFKSGNRSDPANYRPVSLTSHLIKIFERVLRKHLVAHMEDNDLMNDNQHGFRKKRSCVTQLIDHVDHVLKCLNSNDEIDVVYLDYAKAFDKVDHRILLAKLKRYGIRGKLYDWIKDFLTNRYQTVVVEGQQSSPQPVLSGVPQGTVLGPVLFIIYINDMASALNAAKCLSFADDTKLSHPISGENCRQDLQQDLWKVINWSLTNNMQLHENKFEVVNYCLNSSRLLRELPFMAEMYDYITTNGHTIQPTDVVRDLGIYLSNDLSWTPHIQQAVNSARKMAAWVLSVFRDRTPTIMLTLYKSMVRSKLEYCCPVWDTSKRGDIQALESIQRHFTKRISSCSRLPYWERLKRLNLLSLQRRRERYRIIHVWKILNNMAPNDVTMEFSTRERHGIKVKISSFNYKAQKSVSTPYEDSFGIRAGQLWNILPSTVNQITTLDEFKVALGSFLDSDAFPDTPPVRGYTSQNSNSLLDWNRERGQRVGGHAETSLA